MFTGVLLFILNLSYVYCAQPRPISSYLNDYDSADVLTPEASENVGIVHYGKILQRPMAFSYTNSDENLFKVKRKRQNEPILKLDSKRILIPKRIYENKSKLKSRSYKSNEDTSAEESQESQSSEDGDNGNASIISGDEKFYPVEETQVDLKQVIDENEKRFHPRRKTPQKDIFNESLEGNDKKITQENVNSNGNVNVHDELTSSEEETTTRKHSKLEDTNYEDFDAPIKSDSTSDDVKIYFGEAADSDERKISKNKQHTYDNDFDYDAELSPSKKVTSDIIVDEEYDDSEDKIDLEKQPIIVQEVPLAPAQQFREGDDEDTITDSKVGNKKKEDLKTEASDDHKKHKEHHKPVDEKHEKGGGKEHESEHKHTHTKKGDKGYKGKHLEHKIEHGHHNKEGNQGKFKDVGGHEKKHHHEGEYHGDHHKGDKGNKGVKFDEEGKHSKGHSTHGTHNVHKKDEYEKNEEFFDEHHEGGDSEHSGGFFDEGEHKKGGHSKEDHYDGGKHHDEYGKEGHYEHGEHDHEDKGHKKSDGLDLHYGHISDYGKKKGKGAKKKWDYHDGHVPHKKH